MSDRLPPLTALRAFEAAARLLSFAKAADELNVTPAALSFQLKSLEEHLGQRVFRRMNRAVELTEAGRTLAPGISNGFAALSAAWRATRRLADTSVLTVTAGPAFTAKWLAPRLYDFAQAHPDIELRLSASLRIMDFDRDEVDVAIRFGLAAPTPHHSETLLNEWVAPMMSPTLAARYPHPNDLRNAPLLHQDDVAFLRPALDWSAWFAAAGLGAPPPGGLRFSQADHALDTALSGGGIVLGRLSLAARALRDGQLVMPYGQALRTKAHFRMMCPQGAEQRPHIRAFFDWLLAEAAGLDRFERDLTFLDPPETAA